MDLEDGVWWVVAVGGGGWWWVVGCVVLMVVVVVVVHGNMRDTYFVSEDNGIDLQDLKYVSGETGVAEMCNLFCSKLGRVHVHFIPCEKASASQCVHGGGGNEKRRHSSKK